MVTVGGTIGRRIRTRSVFDAGEQVAQHGGRLGAALAHVEMRVGAVADEGVDQIDHAVRDIGVQVVGRDDRHVRPDDPAHPLEQHALGIVLLGRQRRAVGADIDAVDRQRRVQPALHRVEQFLEEVVLDRPVRLGHRQRDADRLPRPGRVHRRDKARRLGQHRRGRAARLADDGVAFEIGAGEEMRLRRRRRELVALDREAEEGDAGAACRPPALAR